MYKLGVASLPSLRRLPACHMLNKSSSGTCIKDGVFSFWLSALVENSEVMALSLAGAASGYHQRVTAGR